MATRREVPGTIELGGLAMLAKSYHVVLDASHEKPRAGIHTNYHQLTRHMRPDTAEAWPMGLEPVSLFGQPEQTRPSSDAFRERYLRNFTGWNVPKSERTESLTLDVALAPAEALRGCVVPVGVPVFGTCPECDGTGHLVPFRCMECAGSGLVEEERILRVHVPPRVQAGTILEAPLEMFGIRNLYLRVHVSISDAI
jgi:hypothetical protein